MRLAAYGTISTLVASGVVLQAFHQRANFYSACVHLAQSNACLMILTNFGFFMTLMFGKMIQKIFYGPLRPTEVEHLYEKAWYAITETCLAMTIFRDEFHSGFIAMFTILLFVKCFHWLANDRVDFMEQTPPARPYLFHARLASSLFLLFTIDFLLCRHCVLTLMDLPKPNMLVMFAFEFAILLVNCSSTIGKYLIGITERIITARKTRQLRERRRRQLQRRVDRGDISEEEMRDTLLEEEETGDVIGAWESKSSWGFNLDIATDLLKLTIYLLFFGIVLMFYGLPLHIVRDVYMTVRSFIGRVRDFISYRKATQHMNSRYPDATREEIAREAVCIICREDMVAWSDTPGAPDPQAAPVPADEDSEIIDERLRPKKLPCGHVLHLSCLKGWMERQQRCPTCRRPVLDGPANGQAAANQRGGQANQQWAAPGGGAPEGNAGGANQPPAQGAPQGQAQAPGGDNAPNNIQPQPAAAPAAAQPGLGFNMLMPGGGLVGALARNLAERQRQGLPPVVVPDQVQVPANTQGIPTLQPHQNDITTQLTQNTAQVVQIAIQEVVNQQQIWNQRMVDQMRLMTDEMISIRNSLGVPVPPPTRTTGQASTSTSAPTSSTAGTPSRTTAGLSAGQSTPASTSQGPRAATSPGLANPAAAPVGTSTGTSTGIGSGISVDSTHAPSGPFPPGYQLPPGWSLIPLYPVAQGGQASGFTTPQHNQPVVYSTPPTNQPPSTSASHQASPSPLPSDISLSSSGIRRRGVHRQYSNNLHTYHSMSSPRREEPNPFASAQFSAPPDASSPSTSGQQTANTLSSPSRQMAGMNNSPHQATTSSSPSRHGSISSTSREVLERRHREAHSPRTGSNLSPAGSVRSQQSASNTSSHLTNLSTSTESSLHQVFSPMGPSSTSITSSGRRSDAPTLDTSAEHNHTLHSTHDPTQGRSPTEERRRASAGEILLSETDTAWPAPATFPGSGPESEASLSPSPSLPGSRVGSVRRPRRSSGAGLTGPGGNGSHIGSTGVFNVIPKSQTSSAAGSPVMKHSLGHSDLGSPSRISLDKGKKKSDAYGQAGMEDSERGRARIKEEEEGL
ncbi:hypothetical protein H072_9253 [Dactylellina haptotyla CBS 200.50]|uniref:RING-type E3 ubiquitin transferase n=1 Tax=Dactylellina haptotyla (strain CBS 200.50) TaxID=1284197 RepID=S8BPG8_DACHA|nr:hypothetical protein H072_9253 [Dactylellina haptotyla CBS 200.50]